MSALQQADPVDANWRVLQAGAEKSMTPRGQSRLAGHRRACRDRDPETKHTEGKPVEIVDRIVKREIELERHVAERDELEADTATTEATLTSADVLLEESDVDKSLIAVVAVPSRYELGNFDGAVAVELDDDSAEILELMGATHDVAPDPKSLGEQLHPTRAEHEFVTATPAHVWRRQLSEPAEADFDPTDHDTCYMLDGEHACSLALHPVQE